MTMIIEAPFPGITDAIIFPNPDLGNTEGRDVSVNFKQSMDGSVTTYVRSSQRKSLSFTWNVLGRGKLVEIQEFYKLFSGNRLKLTDFRGDVWDVIFAEDPVTITVETLSQNAGGARTESGSLTLEFLGAQIA